MAYAIMPGGYTQLERRMATTAGFSVENAVQYLKQDARIRCVRDTLERCSNMQGADKRALKEALVALLLQSSPTAKRDSIDKNVRNWLADDTQVISKGYAIQLAYALHMPVDNADVWLTRLSGEAFHWRNPEDIVWIFGLINGLDYAAANALQERIKEKGLLDVPDVESVDTMTAQVRQEVAQLRTEEELESFLATAKGQLGRMHNTAYRMFSEFMHLLQAPGDYSPASMTREEIEKKRKDGKETLDESIPEDKDMSVRDIIANYMYNEYIPRAKRRGKKQGEIGRSVKSAIQRSIQKNWPDETILSKMKQREIDVTRKVLILLFLATDGEESEYAEQEEMDADEAFESMETRLNLMLADCGFAQLDSRTPFDWMVLYCMYADESIFLEDYMRGFLENLFKGSTEEDKQNV